MLGLLNPKHCGWLTGIVALLLIGLLWPVLGVAGVPAALVFSRLLALDLTTYTLPDIYTLPLMATGLGVAWGHHLGITAAVWGGLLVLASVGRYCASSRLGMGEGDLKLLAALVAWLGPVAALAAVGVGCLLWLPVACLTPKRPLPLGVPLLLGWGAVLAWPALPNALFSPITI